MCTKVARATFLSLFSLSLAAATLSASDLARAQDNVTVAEGLFREGRELMDKNDYDAACNKFAESQRLDPSSGTLLNLASCHEKQGKIATAWAEYLAAGRLARSQNRPEREAEAKQRAAELEPKVSYLKIVLSEKLAGTLVKIDDVSLTSSALGSRIPVDPGERNVEISAPGHKPLSMKVTIGAEHDVQTLTVPKLEVDPNAGAAPGPDTVPDTPGTPPVGTPPPTSDAGAEPAPSSPVLAYVVGGAGVVALGVGTAFAFMARSSYQDAEDECPSTTGCSKEAMDLRDKAETRANIANVGVGLGLVGIGVATVLLLSQPSAKSPAAQRTPIRSGFSGLRVEPYVSSHQAGVSLSGVTF